MRQIEKAALGVLVGVLVFVLLSLRSLAGDVQELQRRQEAIVEEFCTFTGLGV